MVVYPVILSFWKVIPNFILISEWVWLLSEFCGVFFVLFSHSSWSELSILRFICVDSVEKMSCLFYTVLFTNKIQNLLFREWKGIKQRSSLCFSWNVCGNVSSQCFFARFLSHVHLSLSSNKCLCSWNSLNNWKWLCWSALLMFR